MNIKKFASLFVFCSMVGSAHADDAVIGKIQMIEPYLSQSLVYITLKGYPTLNGGGCAHTFFVASMSNANFKSFLYPVLLTAKATDADIKLIVNGCNGAYPIIVGVEYSPR